MSRPNVYRRFRNLVPAEAMHAFVLGFADYGQADEATGYESYFGDEVTSATCDGICIEEWVMKPTFRCEMEIDDQHNSKCRVVVSCVIVDAVTRRSSQAEI